MNSVGQSTWSSTVVGPRAEDSPADSVESLREKVARAREAQSGWAALPVRERARAIFRIRDWVVSHADELAEIIRGENGKTRIDALATEVLPAALAATYYARHARRLSTPQRLWPATWVMFNKSSRVHRRPWGVIAVISPWNYPFGIPFSEVVMGLLAGNGVVLKVASQTPKVGRALERCFLAAGLPEGLFAYVELPGRVAGDALLEAGIHKLFFTGSVSVGKRLMAKAAETLTPVCLELGGNDPMLVAADADLDRAAAGAVWAGMQNCGQSCAGIERIYVHRDVYEPFLERLGDRVRALRVGLETEHQVDLGAMTTAEQVQTVRRHIEDALARGAKVFAQSGCPPGPQFLPAMVLTGVDHSMLVMREETFGPVVGVMQVEDMDEAVRLANDTEFGLTASVWSRNRRRARQLGSRLQAGVVTINDHLVGHGLPETPWGGFKQSGIGRTHGAIGMAEMTQVQCVVDDFLPGVKNDLWWHPHRPGIYAGLKGLMEMLYGPGLARRARGLWAALKIAPRMFRVERGTEKEQ